MDFSGTCAVCEGSRCTKEKMTPYDNLIYGGHFTECSICYITMDAENDVQRGCTKDIPWTWNVPKQYIEEVPYSGSVCYPSGKGDGSEICLCKGFHCNLNSLEDIGGNFKYDKKKITCNCQIEKCPKYRKHKFKCYKPKLLPIMKCDCQKCTCV